MSNNDIVISTKNLSKVYKLYKNPKDRLKEALSLSGKIYHKDFYALKEINLEIRRGEVIGIVGKNGSGKSTLLKILSRVLTQTSGEFIVKGKVSSLLELGSGFNPELTGLENVYFYGTILGFSEEKIKEKLPEILDFADIGDFIYQPLKTYSSGMKARLAFSVAINVDPDILILDEVLAVGDELFRRKCYARMEGFFKGQKTILFVSHSVSDINQLCTRAVMLDRGEFLIEGPPKLVTTHYQRYLFASFDKITQVRREIVLMNMDDEAKNVHAIDIPENQKSSDHVRDLSSNKEAHELSDKPSPFDNQKPYYIPNLITKSRVEYRNSDVDIYDVCITTLDGIKVNVLVTGEQYVFCYKVKFWINAKNISFGMGFKSEKGLHLTGSETSSFIETIEFINTGSIFSVKWLFLCCYLEGNYFANIGVMSHINGEKKILNRIVDGLIFKVQTSSIRIFNGFIYANQTPIVIHH